MKLRRVDHIDLVVSDIQAATEFYKKLGLAVQGTLEGGSTVFLWNGDETSPLVVELHQAQDGQEAGIGHIAFLVDDVEQACQEGKAAGVTFDHEPFHSNESGRTVVTFKGPNGLGLQLARKTSRGEFEDFR